MKKYTYIIITFLMIFISSITINAQSRPDIMDNSLFSNQDRTELANLIIDFVTPEILQLHCNYTIHMSNAGYNIHDDFNFLPFHRTYLERLEDWLISQGHPEYVPLPKWTGLVSPPSQFSIVSPACGTTSCADLSGPCGTPTGNGTVFLPPILRLPIQSGSGNDLCDLNFNPNQYTITPDDTGANSLSRVIEGGPNSLGSNWHNSGHGMMGGVMLNFKSPAAAIFWLWHAGVDDKWKEWEQNCPQSTTQPVDLYMKDNQFVVEYYRDRGEEPNIDDGPMWVSKDIWIRNQADGVLNQTHQNPEYGQENFIYVRVRNRGYQTSLGSEQLNLYWAKANTALTWPNHWNGTMTVGSGISLGEPVGVQNIPQIDGQDQTIVQFAWNPPNPDDYDGLIDNIQHFCLLARIEATNDPMANEVNGSVYQNTRNNNNIVWKNISVVDLQTNRTPPRPTGEIAGATITIGNINNIPQNFDIKFQLPRHYKGNAILDEAEVTVLLDDKTWEKFNDNGRQNKSLKVFKEDKKQILIENDKAILKNLHFDANEQTLIKLSFNFLAKKMSGQKNFVFDVIQTIAGTDEIIGGERFEIIVDGKEGFYADAGDDVIISQGDIIDLNAYEVNEDAIYNWYDQDGNLIYTGSDVTVSPEITKKYKLEIISEMDGIKDYDEIVVNVKEYELREIAPNPANGQVTINYKANNASSAYLMVTQSYGATYNYILDVNQDGINLNLDNYQTGVYYVVLICNGQAVDSKTLIVE